MGKQDKRDSKQDKRDSKQDGKQAKWAAKTELSLAKARKRKWLFMILAAGIVLYLLVSKGGLGGIGELLDKLKGIMPGG